MKNFIFGIYSWLTQIMWIILDVLPFTIRNLLFKLLFKKYKGSGFIDYGCYFRYMSKISIGKGVTINRGSKMFASHFVKDAEIIIGDNVAIGPEVTIFSAGHDYSSIKLPDIAKSVIIQDDVWIGGRCIILPGVNIGRGVVVGAGSVITKDIPEWSIAVGNPAHVIRKRELNT